MRDYDKETKEMRKLAHGALSPSAVRQYHVMQEDLAAVFAKDMLDDPENYRQSLRLYVKLASLPVPEFDWFFRTSSRFILSVTYGLSLKVADEEVHPTACLYRTFVLTLRWFSTLIKQRKRWTLFESLR